MDQRERAKYYLEKKLDLLAAIAANTSLQQRFILTPRMKGMRRAFQEREKLLEELAALNKELASDRSWAAWSELKPLLQTIEDRQREVLTDSRQLVQEAGFERARIAAELRKRKMDRQLGSRYVKPWAALIPGRRINEKG